MELLRAWLKWQPEDDVAVKSTGRSLLLYAALADDTEAVRLLLQHHGTASLNITVRNPDLAMGESPITPLIGAMTCGSFAVARQLLEAKADPKLRITRCDALMCAAYLGSLGNAKEWLVVKRARRGISSSSRSACIRTAMT